MVPTALQCREGGFDPWSGNWHPTCHGETKPASSSITQWQIDGKTMETVTDFILGAPKSLQIVIAAMKLKDPYFVEM